MLYTTKTLLNADALAGIAKPARASVSISIDTLMNAEARAGFPFGSLFLIIDCRVGSLSSVDLARKLLGTGFQKALRAFWGEARPGFGVH